ncbi:MAG: hypothetical protein ABUL60_25785 [Myxococcales bacterium]
MNDQVLRRVVRCATFLLLSGFAVPACTTDGASNGSPGAGASVGVGGTSTGVGGTSTGVGASATHAGQGGSATGGDASRGGSTTQAGSAGSAGSSGSASVGGAAGCDSPGLVWGTAQKTWYTSYPDPGSEECVKYNGCTWAGQFSACDGKKSEAWVSTHDIVAAFPDFARLQLHDLCLKSGNKTLVVTVLDTCGDDDCGGCCTQNQGSADELIDIESYTNARFGVEDGAIEWADLGPTRGDGCN